MSIGLAVSFAVGWLVIAAFCVTCAATDLDSWRFIASCSPPWCCGCGASRSRVMAVRRCEPS